MGIPTGIAILVGYKAAVEMADPAKPPLALWPNKVLLGAGVGLSALAAVYAYRNPSSRRTVAIGATAAAAGLLYMNKYGLPFTK
jgi:hypothetical protein